MPLYIVKDMSKKRWLFRIGILAILCVVVLGVILYSQPRTVFLIEPGRINAAGLIDKIAPGNSLTVYGKVSNPHFESNAVKIVFLQPKQDYVLKYDLFGTGKVEDRISPAVTYTPAPKEAEQWITLETDNKTVWGVISLSPYQSKSIPLNISIPEDAQLPKHWYFIIENRNAEESGLVVTRNDCLVLINMR